MSHISFSESLVLLFRIEPNILPDELETTRLQLLKSAKKIGYCFFRDANREIFNEEDLAAIKEAEEEDQVCFLEAAQVCLSTG